MPVTPRLTRNIVSIGLLVLLMGAPVAFSQEQTSEVQELRERVQVL